MKVISMRIKQRASFVFQSRLLLFSQWGILESSIFHPTKIYIFFMSPPELFNYWTVKAAYAKGLINEKINAGGKPLICFLSFDTRGVGEISSVM